MAVDEVEGAALSHVKRERSRASRDGNDEPCPAQRVVHVLFAIREIAQRGPAPVRARQRLPFPRRSSSTSQPTLSITAYNGSKNDFVFGVLYGVFESPESAEIRCSSELRMQRRRTRHGVTHCFRNVVRKYWFYEIAGCYEAACTTRQPSSSL